MVNNCKIVFKFFRIKLFGRILFFAVFPLFTLAQNPVIHNDSLNDLSVNKNTELVEPIIVEEKVKKVRASFLYSIVRMKDIDDLNNYIEADKLLKGGINSIGGIFKVDYSINKNWGFGIECFFWKEVFQTDKYFGSEVQPAQLWGFIPASIIEYYDLVYVEYKNTSIGAFCTYQLLHYSKANRQPFEISIRTGISYDYLFVTHDIVAAEYIKNSTSYNNKSFAYELYNFSSFTGMFGLQLTCRLNKSLSLILFDFSDYFNLGTMDISEMSANCVNGKTITLKNHPVNSACLAYSFGFNFHF